MGAPKLKWTSEEEAALKAGIKKYGTGKWSTIIKDPEFSRVLQSRSNVDLKDKWRNLNCMTLGVGSRQRGRGSMKSIHPIAKQDEDTSGCSMMVIDKDVEVLDVTPPPLQALSNEVSQDRGSKRQISRLDDHVLDSITKLKEPRGSSRAAIAHYVEEHYSAPPDLERTLATCLKTLTENGLLVKVKHQYRIAPRPVTFAAGEASPMLLGDAAPEKDPSEVEGNRVIRLTRAGVDAELEDIKSMDAKKAAAAAAKAVAEAEAAIAEAKAAAEEAEKAEKEAEAANCFAAAARKALNYPIASVW